MLGTVNTQNLSEKYSVGVSLFVCFALNHYSLGWFVTLYYTIRTDILEQQWDVKILGLFLESAWRQQGGWVEEHRG